MILFAFVNLCLNQHTSKYNDLLHQQTSIAIEHIIQPFMQMNRIIHFVINLKRFGNPFSYVA